MSWKNRQLGQTRFIGLGPAVTVTGTNAAVGVQVPFGQTIALITTGKLAEWVSTGEVWRPLGLECQVTTTTTVTAPKFTLKKGIAGATETYAAASSGGVASTPAVRTAPFSDYCPFTTYLSSAGVSGFIADAAGDKWTVATSTAAGAGAIVFQLGYICIDVAGISDALTTY